MIITMGVSDMTTQLNASKYRIRVEHITPSVPEETIYTHQKCILGVSMSNPVFWRSSLDTMFGWMEENFDHSLILVGDYLQRLNEQILNGDNADLAIQTALEKGNKFVQRTQQFLKNHSAEKFEIYRWKPLYDEPDFQRAKETLHMLYHSNPEVKASIQSTASLFVLQKMEQNDFKVSKERAIQLSAEYLLEEMAVFSMLIDRGWKVVLYPGAQLPLLMEIASGKFRDVPNSLNKGIYVEMKIRKK